MPRCGNATTETAPDGTTFPVYCQGQVPNSRGIHKCSVCGVMNTVDRSPRLGEKWGQNHRANRKNMSKRARTGGK